MLKKSLHNQKKGIFFAVLAVTTLVATAVTFLGERADLWALDDFPGSWLIVDGIILAAVFFMAAYVLRDRSHDKKEG